MQWEMDICISTIWANIVDQLDPIIYQKMSNYI